MPLLINNSLFSNASQPIAFIMLSVCQHLGSYFCERLFREDHVFKNPPAVQETQVRSLGHEEPLEKEMATHSRVLAWEIPGTEEPGGLQSMGSQRVGRGSVIKLTTVSLPCSGFYPGQLLLLGAKGASSPSPPRLVLVMGAAHSFPLSLLTAPCTVWANDPLIFPARGWSRDGTGSRAKASQRSRNKTLMVKVQTQSQP